MSPIKDSLTVEKKFESDFANQREHLGLHLKMKLESYIFITARMVTQASLKGGHMKDGRE